MEPTYTVFAHIPYEGQHDAFQGTREEVKAWLKSPDRSYDLDDLEIYSNDAPDVYELFKED